ncbi:MAG: prepilin-type N-terminal cleavage/methylation domain-containing protein [Phenylobacterium sp.]|jgi:prepilin-type N-terminal cleavage/methylation domain-containing protein
MPRTTSQLKTAYKLNTVYKLKAVHQLKATHQLKAVKGFTLIEVLIASVILFLFLAIASQAFNQSATASRKAERAVKVAGLLPLLTENIRSEIVAVQQITDQSGQGSLFGLHYQWQATLLERLGPPRRLDAEVEGLKTYDERFNLWQVNVTVSEGSYQRSWQYEEISWHK